MHPVSARSVIPAIVPNPASTVRADNAAQPQVTPGGIPGGVPGLDKAAPQASADRTPPTSQLSLSAQDLDALQSVDHGPQGDGKSAQSPAHQARAFIADHPEFADMPFGHVVSQFARGATPTLGSDGEASDSSGPSPDTTDVTPPTDVGDVPPSETTDTSNTDVPPSDIADLPPSDTSETASTTTTDTPPVESTDVPPSDTIDTASNPPLDIPADTTAFDPGSATSDPTQELIDALTA